MRYGGQAFELPVAGPLDPDPAGLRERFERGPRGALRLPRPEGEVVLVDIRLRVGAGTRAEPGGGPSRPG